MRQIPTGEYCGDCPCRNANVCLLYVEQLSFDIQALRDTQCLRDKPQVMTEAQLTRLFVLWTDPEFVYGHGDKAFEQGLKEATDEQHR